MTQRLKSWESPRREGRNDKGKGGAARRRQIKKQMKLLRRKLKGETITKQTKTNSNQTQKLTSKQFNLKALKLKRSEGKNTLPFFWHRKIKISGKYLTKFELIG